MKIVLRAACLGSALILMTNGCAKRDQYNRGPVPTNPDRIKTDLTSDVTPPVALKPEENKPGTQTAVKLTPDEIVKKVSEWNAQPVIWNESVGNIKIGVTDWRAWQEEAKIFTRDSRVKFGFSNNTSNGALCDSAIQNNANVCTTTSGAVIFQFYEGPLAFPKADKTFADVRMNSSLRDSVYTQADSEGVIDLGNPLNSTRGRQFFKNFFNTFIAPRYTTGDVDCFAVGACGYIADAEYYLWYYDAPGGMTGEMILSRDQDRLVMAQFNRPSSIPLPKSLNTEGASLDLLDGSFDLPAVNGGLKFQLGQTAEEFTKLGLPQANWMSYAGQNNVEYSGISFSFLKSNVEKLSDVSYSKADANDPLVVFSIDKNYTSSVSIAGIPLLMQDQEREEISKDDHIKALEKLRLAVERSILQASPDNKIFVSKISGNDIQSVKNGSFVLDLVYLYNKKVFNFQYATYLKNSQAAASLKLLQDYELSLLVPAVNPAEPGRIAGFGPFRLKAPINLLDVDLELTKRATVVLGKKKVRVSLTQNNRTLVAKEGTTLLDLSTFDEVIKFGIGNLTVDVVPCSKLPQNSKPGFCVLALYADQFTSVARMTSFNQTLHEVFLASDKVRSAIEAEKSETEKAETEKAEKLLEADSAELNSRISVGSLAAQIETCQGTPIDIGQSKETAIAALKADKCTVLTSTAESSTTEKTDFYLPETGNNFSVSGEDNRFVGLFQFY